MGRWSRDGGSARGEGVLPWGREARPDPVRHSDPSTIGCRSAGVLFMAAAQPLLSDNRPQYWVDVLVITDLAVYQTWFQRSPARPGLTKREAALANIRQYFTLVLQLANERYRSLERFQDFRLNIRPVGFFIAQTVAQSAWTVRSRNGTRGQVDAQEVLREIGQWIAANPRLPAHDHAMLFTGYDLVTRDRETGRVSRGALGRATVGSLCQRGRSVSVVEERAGAFQSVLTAAHELGHSLGALHDGTGNGCRAEERYVMAPGTEARLSGTSRHPWFFSNCSGAAIASFVSTLLRQPAGTCLTTSLPQNGVPDVHDLVPGQMYGSDEQCQQLQGPTSRLCQGDNFGELSDICTSMFCLVPGRRNRPVCRQYHASQGTSCGDGKWCDTGQCVPNLAAPRLATACPFGDHLTLVNGEPCERAVARQPALCYTDRVQRTCCRTCQNLRDASQPECPYGDRYRTCQRESCRTLYPSGVLYAMGCCRTCRFDAAQWTCADQQGVGGAFCSVALGQSGVQGCYNTTLAFSCCDTCQKRRVAPIIRGCEYGDLLPDQCRSIRRPCTLQERAECCHTCHNDVTDLVTSEVTSKSGSRESIDHTKYWLFLLTFCASLIS